MRLRNVMPDFETAWPPPGFASADLPQRMSQQPEQFLASLYTYAETMLQATLPTAIANCNEKLLNLAHRTLEFMRKVLSWNLEGAAQKRKMELKTQAEIAKMEARALHQPVPGAHKAQSDAELLEDMLRVMAEIQPPAENQTHAREPQPTQAQSAILTSPQETTPTIPTPTPALTLDKPTPWPQGPHPERLPHTHEGAHANQRSDRHRSKKRRR